MEMGLSVWSVIEWGVFEWTIRRSLCVVYIEIALQCDKDEPTHQNPVILRKLRNSHKCLVLWWIKLFCIRWNSKNLIKRYHYELLTTWCVNNLTSSWFGQPARRRTCFWSTHLLYWPTIRWPISDWSIWFHPAFSRGFFLLERNLTLK